MINSKEDLRYYLACDKVALDIRHKKPRIIADSIWRYEIAMRKCAYYKNCRHDLLGRLIGQYFSFKFQILGQHLGFTMGYNSFGPGLQIVHYGTIVVHGSTRVGENCRIQEGVTIGGDATVPGMVPKLGNNICIGSGAKIIGNVSVADRVVIGAGAVVVKSIQEPGITVGGVPARKISDNSSDPHIIKATTHVNRADYYR